MTDLKEKNQLSNEQLQTFLNIDHIRQHLIKVGLINQYGEVIPKQEYERLHKRHPKQRHTSFKSTENKQKYQTFIHRPLTAVNTRHPKNFDQYGSSKSPDRRYKNVSISLSRQRNISPSSTRLSSLHRSTREKSILLRRAISPKIIPINDRCLVTMIYYGPQIPIEYERSWFEPEGDEIIVMQQHCGGENLIVHKGALKPNTTFQFESRRHSDYPFALAFYVNGLIDDRLSICCESRYQHNVRIGGKHGLFGIINVQKSKACRRCRFEQRMKRLAELKDKNTSIINRISTPEPNFTRPTSPELTMSPKKRHESPPSNQKLKPVNSPTAYSPDFDIPDEKIHSSISTPRENEPTSEKNPNHQRRTSIVSIEKDSNDETSRITHQSNTDFENDFSKINQKENTDK